MPDDRPIDGVDQADLLLGTIDTGRRENLLTFVGPDLVAARWKQFRAYFADVARGRRGGVGASAAPMNGYPNGTCIHVYIHVTDLVRAHSDALAYLRGGGPVTLNCGYGHGFSVLEVIDTVKRVSGVDFRVDFAARRPGDPAPIVAKSDRVQTLGWRPKIDDLATIAAHALAWESKVHSTMLRSRARCALPYEMTGWVICKKARRLFSRMDDHYAFDEMDKVGKSNIAKFAAHVTTHCSFARTDDATMHICFLEPVIHAHQQGLSIPVDREDGVIHVPVFSRI